MTPQIFLTLLATLIKITGAMAMPKMVITSVAPSRVQYRYFWADTNKCMILNDEILKSCNSTGHDCPATTAGVETAAFSSMRVKGAAKP